MKFSLDATVLSVKGVKKHDNTFTYEMTVDLSCGSSNVTMACSKDDAIKAMSLIGEVVKVTISSYDNFPPLGNEHHGGKITEEKDKKDVT